LEKFYIGSVDFLRYDSTEYWVRDIGYAALKIGQKMKFIVAIHHPDDFDAFAVKDPAMDQAIDDLNDEMVARGVRLFVGGLHHASTAKSLRANSDGEVLVTDGPYLETKEHIAGFWVLEAANFDEALEWGRKAVIACKAPVEVRQFH
jgi:hypothetical protein